MSAALRELLERACEAYLYSQMRDDRFTAADWMGDAFNAADIPSLLAEVEELRFLVAMDDSDAIRRDGCMWRVQKGATALCQPPKSLREAITRAETAEAALLAKSAEYDALVARIEGSPVGTATEWGIQLDDPDTKTEPGQRVRLLVSDDRPSHTAGENDA